MQLLDSHGADLHRLLARLTRCEHTTRDLMQELFIRLASSSGFDKALNPYAYAWKTAANLAFSRHRREKLTLEMTEATPIPNDSIPAAIDQIIREEELRQVLQITAAFKELARNVIVMRFIEQKSYEQIAERLGKKPAYLRALCSKTLTEIRRKLNAQLSDDIQREVSHG